MHGEKYIGDGSTGTRPNPGGGDHNDQCSDRKCEKCVNPSKGDCGACTCPKKCDDEMCPVCEGCLAGIGGRPAAVATRAAVTHEKCSCPVLCEECGETQKDSEGYPKCDYKFSDIYTDKIKWLKALWNNSYNIDPSKRKEMMGHLLADGRYILHHISNSTQDAVGSGAVRARLYHDKFIIEANTIGRKPIEMQVVSEAHTHLYPKVENIKEYISTYDLYVSSTDIRNANLFGYILIVTHNSVYKLLKGSNETDTMCKREHNLTNQ